MPLTQIIGITLIIMGFLATVKTIHRLISTDRKIKNHKNNQRIQKRIKYCEDRIKEIDDWLKTYYDIAPTDYVIYLNKMRSFWETELFELTNKNTK